MASNMTYNNMVSIIWPFLDEKSFGHLSLEISIKEHRSDYDILRFTSSTIAVVGERV